MTGKRVVPVAQSAPDPRCVPLPDSVEAASPSPVSWAGEREALVLSRVTVRYDTERYPFARVMAGHLGVPDLAALHHEYRFPLLTRHTDQATLLHRRMYEVGGAFLDVYRRFVAEQVLDLIGEDMVFQRVPNFRAQIPGNVGVGYFHRDRDNHHSTTEINFWVPLTPATRHNTIWLESAEGRRDFRPAVLDYGQMLIFDGANLEHGNRVNVSDRTRVSFDFRVIPAAVYEDNPRRTVVMHTPLVIGGYWERLPSRREDAA
jgi:hypothetical protein